MAAGNKNKTKICEPLPTSCKFDNTLYEGLTVYPVNLTINSLSSASIYTLENKLL